MTGGTPNSWPEANQRHLMAAVGVVRVQLENHAARAQGVAKGNDALAAAEAALRVAAEAMPAPTALETLCAAFRLSAFEQNIVLLCAGMELSSEFAALVGTAQTPARRPAPTFGLALAAMPEAHWSALAPGAPLRRWRLVEVAANEGLAAASLRIDERVLHHLTGVDTTDERLQGLLHLIHPAAELPASQIAIAESLTELWGRPTDFASSPIVQLCAGDLSDKRAVAAAVCRTMGLRLHLLRQADIPASAAERESLARLWEREAVLSRSALLIEADEAEEAEGARGLLPFVENVQGIVFVSRRDPVRLRWRPVVRRDVPAPRAPEQTALWQAALGAAAPSLNGYIERLVMQFSLGPQAIRAAVRTSLAFQGECAALLPLPTTKEWGEGRGEGPANESNTAQCPAHPLTPPLSPSAGEREKPSSPADLPRALWEACRAQARPRLDDLAQRLTPVATWRDLVLPDAPLQTLREVAAHVRQRAKVYETWGFAEKSSRGLGISALFAGPSGTGKTMAAEVLANELNLDLYHIDLSAVVSKYIGETEKNLRRVFDAAEQGGAILLFDEADALFGKRSEVKDSHDRYANLEVSYLLQRMEAYRGLAILTTNMKDALDAAFLRRLRFVVQFPFPDTVQRAEIWRRIFPTSTPTDGLDHEKLSRLNVAGGNIRNVALNAAFLAADEGQPVLMKHLLRAARSEYTKLEKPLTTTEIGGWV